MVVTQYRASKTIGVAQESLRKLSKKKPLRPFFILKAGETVFKIDIDHPDWMLYAEHIKIKKGVIIPKTSDNILKLMEAMGNVLESELGGEKAQEIRIKIVERLKG